MFSTSPIYLYWLKMHKIFKKCEQDFLSYFSWNLNPRKLGKIFVPLYVYHPDHTFFSWHPWDRETLRSCQNNHCLLDPNIFSIFLEANFSLNWQLLYTSCQSLKTDYFSAQKLVSLSLLFRQTLSFCLQLILFPLKQ